MIIRCENLSPIITKPHVLLLGAGASKAALPNGDKYGNKIPLLRELARTIHLESLFPDDLKSLATENFEAAYSQLHARGDPQLHDIEIQISTFFEQLELPEEPNLYDHPQLCLREKDLICTFNWDPLLVQSRLRLLKINPTLEDHLPQLVFLHGNVAVGYCNHDRVSGPKTNNCAICGKPFLPSPLLFPVENKGYQDGALIEREWEAVQSYLRNACIFSIFGYSAPLTDVEAIRLLKDGWGQIDQRQLEQSEVISRPESDPVALRATWDPFIHTHHYDIFDSFSKSWLFRYPRRTGERWYGRFIMNQWINDNPVPDGFPDIESMIDWFAPLLANESEAC